MDVLSDFDPRVAGTLPLGISVSSSDIDILCHAVDVDEVGRRLLQWPERPASLSLRRWTSGSRPLIANISIVGWPVEVFASPVPVERQEGWRHFLAEKRLLEIGGEPLRDRIVKLRQAGKKTEPAFAELLGLTGDPYDQLYALADQSDHTLRRLLMHAGCLPV